MSAPRETPVLSLSLDLDDKWTYLKTHGDPGWEDCPGYVGRLVEIVLEKLDQHGLRITFFLVGKDAARPDNQAALRSITAAGHEVGNHSYSHEPWLHEYSPAEMEEEIASAEEAIHSATGRRPIGFRGPGYSLSKRTLQILAGRGYLYDASTLPTFLGPLARAYYLFRSRGMSRAERARRSRLFGSWSDGFRPLKPHLWADESGTLVEIPVTTMPVLRLPLHQSYLTYLATRSKHVSRLYRGATLGACRWTGVSPSFLLHPLDFLGGDEVDGLDFFPGMNLTTRAKLALFDETIAAIQRSFRVITMEEHARAVLQDEAVVQRRIEAASLP